MYNLVNSKALSTDLFEFKENSLRLKSNSFKYLSFKLNSYSHSSVDFRYNFPDPWSQHFFFHYNSHYSFKIESKRDICEKFITKRHTIHISYFRDFYILLITPNYNHSLVEDSRHYPFLKPIKYSSGYSYDYESSYPKYSIDFQKTFSENVEYLKPYSNYSGYSITTDGYVDFLLNQTHLNHRFVDCSSNRYKRDLILRESFNLYEESLKRTLSIEVIDYNSNSRFIYPNAPGGTPTHSSHYEGSYQDFYEISHPDKILFFLELELPTALFKYRDNSLLKLQSRGVDIADESEVFERFGFSISIGSTKVLEHLSISFKNGFYYRDFPEYYIYLLSINHGFYLFFTFKENRLYLNRERSLFNFYKEKYLNFDISNLLFLDIDSLNFNSSLSDSYAKFKDNALLSFKLLPNRSSRVILSFYILNSSIFYILENDSNYFIVKEELLSAI